METFRQVIGAFLLFDLGVGFLLLIATLLAKRRSGVVGQNRGLLAAFGCLTLCLLLIYAGLWALGSS